MAATSSSQRGTPCDAKRYISSTTTLRIDSPECIRSNALLMSLSGIVCVIRSSMLILPSMYQSTIFGTSVRPRAPPNAVPFQTRPGDQLERTRLDLLARARDADDHRHAPAAMAALERLAHQLDVADALEAVVGAAVGQRDQVLHQIAADFLRIDEVGHAELLGERAAPRIEVDADDAVRADQLRALHDVQADAAQAEHDDVRARLDLRRVDDRADAGRDAAADVADLVERRVLADLRERDLRQHRVIRERRAAHVVMDLVLADREAARAVRHHALALRRADRRAQIGLARQARLALAALRRVQRNDVIADLQRGHAATDVDHDAGAFVTEDHREQAFGIRARARELIGVAHAARLDLDQHLAVARSIEVDGDDFERFAGGLGDGGASFHWSWPRQEGAERGSAHSALIASASATAALRHPASPRH